MPDTTYVTIKFSGSGKNFISHYYLEPGVPNANVLEGAQELELLTRANQADAPGVSNGSIVSITRTMQRRLAREDIKETNDLVALSPHIVTGRLIRVAGANNFTQPWIMRGVSPGATKPVGFLDTFGANYLGWIREFMLKYGRVSGGAPTQCTVVKDALMH